MFILHLQSVFAVVGLMVLRLGVPALGILVLGRILNRAAPAAS